MLSMCAVCEEHARALSFSTMCGHAQPRPAAVLSSYSAVDVAAGLARARRIETRVPTRVDPARKHGSDERRARGSVGVRTAAAAAEHADPRFRATTAAEPA